MKNIAQPAFLAIHIHRPSFREQVKIGEILEIWERAIDQSRHLVVAKRRMKHGLMQQLLTGTLRFSDFDARWQERPLGDFLTESRVAGSDGRHARKLTIKLYGKGVTAKSETRAGSKNTRYYKRKAGQFIYSKLDFLNGAFGLVPEAFDGYETTLDLPAFDISEEMHAPWLLYFVMRAQFYTRQLGFAAGGRKARRVNPRDFLRIRVPVPALEEQKRIADALGLVDREIDLLRQQLAALQQQKKGLMQKLLTGQIRVRV